MSLQTSLKHVKVVILGDSGVGKSSIMHRFVSGNFKAESEATLGGAFMAKIVNIHGIQIWDTAGQEKYHSLASMYYRDAQIAVLVYDITKRDSFESLKKWRNELKENGPKDLMIAVVGNKIDLLDQEEVSTDAGYQFAKDIGAMFKTSSAKQDKGITELFELLGEEIWKKDTAAGNKETICLNEAANQKQKGCCGK